MLWGSRSPSDLTAVAVPNRELEIPALHQKRRILDQAPRPGDSRTEPSDVFLRLPPAAAGRATCVGQASFGVLIMKCAGFRFIDFLRRRLPCDSRIFSSGNSSPAQRRHWSAGGAVTRQPNMKIGQWCWRVTIRFEDGDAYDVDLIDYH